MSSEFEAELGRRLADIERQQLRRELRQVDSPQSTRIQIAGHVLLNFSSNDYLGLANHPALKNGAAEAVRRFGTGSGASRLVCGSLAPHHELEEAIAAFKGVQAALSFSSGYAAASGAICALVGKGDLIVLDKLVHACIVDAAKLSGAKLRVFAHNDLNDLEDKLKWARSPGSDRTSRVLIATESIFSMDGHQAPLQEIVRLKEQHGAWLMVDEAHATGVLGKNGAGLADKAGVSRQIEVLMGTLGKALGSSGGYICGSRTLVDYLINRARTFIFSTAPTPATSAAATAGIKLAASREGDDRRQRLWQHVLAINSKLKTQNSKLTSPIIPIHIGPESVAVEAATSLRAQGIFLPAIRYPTVARGQARLRLTVTAEHTPADIETLTGTLQRQLGHLSPGLAQHDSRNMTYGPRQIHASARQTG